MVGDRLGVGGADADVDQGDARTVGGHQVIGRHLVAPPGRGVVEQPVGIVPGLDQDAARARDAGEARTFAQLLHGPADELVDIAMIVGEQDVLLEMLDRGAGIVAQAGQREIGAQRVEQRERAGVVGRQP